LYDIFYYPEKEPIEKIKYYDFITATEVFEHLRNPKKELELLMSLIKTKGWIGIMTKRL